MIKAIKSDELEHDKSAGKNNHYNYAQGFYMKDSIHTLWCINSESHYRLYVLYTVHA